MCSLRSDTTPLAREDGDDDDDEEEEDIGCDVDISRSPEAVVCLASGEGHGLLTVL
jgi:hypothetical protein